MIQKHKNMAGLGKYKKGVAFTLKSGNKPTFVQMGSSPANLNNFGIGQGGSPYKDNHDDTDDGTDNKKETEKNKVIVTGEDATADENTKAGDPKEKAWKKALKVGTTLLSGGIQGVYGGSRHAPKVSWGKWTQEELDDSAAQRLLKNGPDASKTKIDPKTGKPIVITNSNSINNEEVNE
jgi:hypothetical protein